MYIDSVNGSGLVFGFPEIIQFLLFSFVTGGLVTTVKQHGKKQEALEARHDKLEEKFLIAIQDLGDNFHKLTTEIKTVLATHETRLDNMDKTLR